MLRTQNQVMAKRLCNACYNGRHAFVPNLYYVERRLAGMAGMSGPLAAGIPLISTGIGLHNLGEGQAIGAAIGLGQAALGAFLIVGFALHIQLCRCSNCSLASSGAHLVYFDLVYLEQ